jgi:hypothetical protein
MPGLPVRVGAPRVRARVGEKTPDSVKTRVKEGRSGHEPFWEHSKSKFLDILQT